MWPIGETRVYRWAWGAARPGLVVLLALGWTIEAVDDRYGSVLMSQVEGRDA